LVARAPDGLDARVIGEIALELDAGSSGAVCLVHVARDAERMRTIAEGLAFFAPQVEVLTFPAWDCLPYDRVSPSHEMSSDRMDVLGRVLATGGAAQGPRVLLTTVAAALQRVLPRERVSGAVFHASVGAQVDIDRLVAFLAANGYERASTVREAGEYAVRGGIIDIFPSGADQPVRLDFFGDQLEAVRHFDPLTQISTGKSGGVRLSPVGEVMLDGQSVERFRQGYRAHFGAVTAADPLFEAVSEGRRHIGMEHWLPLFHDNLETLFDYLPDAMVTLDYMAEEAVSARLELIGEQYSARVQSQQDSAGLHTPYKPLPPEYLYVSGDEWPALLAARKVARFAPHSDPGDGPDGADAGGVPGRSFAPERAQPDVDLFSAVRSYCADAVGAGRRVVIGCISRGSRDRLASLLDQHDFGDLALIDDWLGAGGLRGKTVTLAVLGLSHGFAADDIAVISEQDILGDRLVRRRKRARHAEAFLSEVSSLGVGDFVVHAEHGIGRYEGLQTLDVSDAPHDCVALSYAAGDRLFIPVENIEVLSRYGSDDSGVTLDRLGGSGWQARKARLKKRIKDIADDLIRIAAARLESEAEAFHPPPGLYDEFCSRFPFDLTEDQQSAIGDVLDDLAVGRPMDRLICGDVGYGKTEIALRSAFIMAMSGKQVAVVVPTTLLSRQHTQTFRERFAGFPLEIGQLSRMVPAKEAAEVKDGLASGRVDIVIGTHAILGKTLKIKHLGMVVVDEEQHFGVVHKERLKAMRSQVHVLTMTATPIPRTLQMALSGTRELSLIATPPVDRMAVRTFIMPFDGVMVREAILRERFRGGQVFYVCPRISDIPDAEKFLREKVPEVRIGIAHGRMNALQLDSAMSDFYEGAVDVLLCTNIIESGLDVPAANTMIVHRADMFGLAQLYQLRGRVGRSKVRAYAYLTILPGRVPTAAAEQRLHVLQTLDQLGAGFSLASHDLDIRGAGNLLGEEQSGHIREVGFELYQEMLEEAIAAARDDGTAAAEDLWSPQIGIGTSVLIPETYVSDLSVRLGLYRRIARMEEANDIEAFAAELIDRFGVLPNEVEHLIQIVAIKGLCRAAGVEKLDAGARGATVSFRAKAYANPSGLVEFITAQAGTAKLRPDHTLVYQRNWDDAEDRLKGVRHLVERLAIIAQAEAVTGSSPSTAALSNN
jgi:transcription-repair coupling factor (superfamily II helicase)